MADKLDPEKTVRYPFTSQVRTLGKENLDLTVLRFLEEELVSMVRDGKFIHPETMDGRNGLWMKISPPRGSLIKFCHIVYDVLAC